MPCAKSGVVSSVSRRRLQPDQTAGASAGTVPAVRGGPDSSREAANSRTRAMRLARALVRSVGPGLPLAPVNG